MKNSQGRFLLGDAWPLAEKIAEYLRCHEEVGDAQVVGSIRRRAETVGDIDIVVSATQPGRVIDVVSLMPGIARVAEKNQNSIKAILSTGMELDIRIVSPEKFAGALHLATGSRRYWEKLTEYATSTGKKVSLEAADERELYQSLGLSYIPPELREGHDEIELAAAGKIPQLVKAADIRGAFHIHTSYSDGRSSLVEMARTAMQRGWDYLGIADHSQTAAYARGLSPERVLAQRREIDKFNRANCAFTIFAGIESDILPDGSLDYPDEILAQFDFVVASVHSSFRMNESAMTRRMITAMSNRHVTLLGHPTGRILLARPGYAVDLAAIIEAAAGTGTMIEINASPYRLDLDWRWCRHARDKGVMLAVNPDAHTREELDYMYFGIAAARKGWLEPENILNTHNTEEVRRFLKQKRSS